MSHRTTLLLLFLAVVAVGTLFFRIVWPFVFPLFFAAVLAILFRPLYVIARRYTYGHDRIAAGLLTFAIVVVILVPLVATITLAGLELVEVGKELADAIELPETPEQAREFLHLDTSPRLRKIADFAELRFHRLNTAQIQQTSSEALLSITTAAYERTSAFAANVVEFTVGLVIMLVAFYYFLADGDSLLRGTRNLVPLDEEDQQVLLAQFDSVCRGVVVGTLVAGVVQGILAGLGFAIVGVDRIWLLGVLTIPLSFVPFLGAASVWLVVAVGLMFEQRFGAAGFITIYGTVVISGSDNLIRAYVIHDRAHMHPLIALVTVLGALQLVGLWGIFLGPIAAAFFYALLKTFKKKLLDEGEDESPNETPPAIGLSESKEDYVLS